MHQRQNSLLLFMLSLLLAGCSGNGSNGQNTNTGGSRLDSACSPGLASEATPASRPATIPALREWAEATGAFNYIGTSRIVVESVDQSVLMPVAEVLADDLETMTGKRPTIARTAGTKPVAGDILLSLGECDSRVGAEGYRMTSGEIFKIRAAEDHGAFYGTRSLLQLLQQASEIPAGEALDWPRYPERGLMVDVGRKYFTSGWIERHLKEMAWLKMNYFHLHFSENLRFGLESEDHPEILAEQHLTKDEVREIVALAARYHITVVPEIGMPGHMGGVLAPHPEFQIVDIFGQPSPNNLDVTNPAAVAYAFELIEEFLPLFPGPYWNTGGDEYIPFYEYPRYPQLAQYAQEQYGPGANGKDAVHGHINQVAEFVTQHGKITRAYNDDFNGGSVVIINPDIIIEWWTDFSPIGDLILLPTPQELLDLGHTIMNISYWPTYQSYDGLAGVQPRPDMATAYQTWEVNMFCGAMFAGPLHSPCHIIDPDEPRNLGTKLHIFPDNPDEADIATEDEIAAEAVPRLRVIAQKAWNSPLLTPSYAAFQPIMNVVGHAPGY